MTSSAIERTSGDQLVAAEAAAKRVHHLKSPAETAAFMDAVKRECARA
jgi:hypothetical protein